MTDISVVGLGVMGRALSCALLKKGYSLTVWNLSKEKAEELVLLGAILANSVREAIVSSEVTIICVASHVQSIEILNHCRGSLKDKIIIDLSTGNATDAEYLAKLVSNNQANWLIGIINAFPAAIGKSETVLMMVGEHKTWQKGCDIIKILGGNSIHIGTQAGMLATLFAALFTIRQGFMFGMIYGGVICKKAGIPLAIWGFLHNPK